MSQLDMDKIPQHVAIIMDGNGRWAKRRGMPRVYGHRQGAQTIKTVTEKAHELGIKVLTLYAFSTENWGRPNSEVNYLMNLPKVFFDEYLPILIEKNIKVTTLGDLSRLPESTHHILFEVLDQTKDNTGMILNFAINYGSHEEILFAVKEIASKVDQKQMQVEEIDIETIEQHLTTHFLGDLTYPDLMIRTSGELRLSNFLLWQLAYAEFYFTDTLWPDFKGPELEKAIADFQTRDRRYGKL